MYRILSGILAPQIKALTNILIGHAQPHRQAKLAIAIRQYEHEHGSLPEKLDELSIDLNELKPFGATPFGYQRDGSKAALWGFDLSDRENQVPLELPSRDPGIPFSKDNIPVVWEINPRPGL